MTLAFGLGGGWEWFVIFLIILLIFGPKKIPGLARSLGKANREFKEAKNAFNDALTEEEAAQQKEKKSLEAPENAPVSKSEAPIEEKK